MIAEEDKVIIRFTTHGIQVQNLKRRFLNHHSQRSSLVKGPTNVVNFVGGPNRPLWSPGQVGLTILKARGISETSPIGTTTATTRKPSLGCSMPSKQNNYNKALSTT